MAKEKVKKKDRNVTQELIDKFDNLCEEYAYENIDTEMLKKGLIEVIDNWS